MASEQPQVVADELKKQNTKQVKKIDNSYKVSKIMIWPVRKMNLKDYNTLDLSAGFELTFDKPVPVDSPLIEEAFGKLRAKIQKEFREQLEALGRKKKA